MKKKTLNMSLSSDWTLILLRLLDVVFSAVDEKKSVPAHLFNGFNQNSLEPRFTTVIELWTARSFYEWWIFSKHRRLGSGWSDASPQTVFSYQKSSVAVFKALFDTIIFYPTHSPVRPHKVKPKSTRLPACPCYNTDLVTSRPILIMMTFFRHIPITWRFFSIKLKAQRNKKLVM